ncbi:MAG: hypothetical protein IPI32_15220 [Austwickia sp.]|nr:hypothetical protein [Austwickia sp.]
MKHPAVLVLAPLLAASTLAQPVTAPAPTASKDVESGVTASPSAPSRQEVATLRPRLLIAHAQGLTAVDALTGRVLTQTAMPRFLRLANAGDGRHAMVIDGDTFRVFDMGLAARLHGDHYHYTATQPRMTPVTYAAPHAGHVVLHHGRTTLFADGTGAIQVIPSAQIAAPKAPIQRFATTTPHHGVALMLADGGLLTTQGTAAARTTVQVLHRGKVSAETTNCPGVHGETVAQPTRAGDVVALGCENGPVVYRDRKFWKVPVKDAYSRSGNLFGHHESPLVLADYKVVKKMPEGQGPERPTRVAIIDTRRLRLDLLDLGTSYWFRSFARGPQGEGLVLGYDGRLRVIDMSRRSVTKSIPVISAWKENTDWQLPGPAVKVAGAYAYVTDAAKKQVAVVDLNTKRVTARYTLAQAPVEFVAVTGRPEAPADDHSDDHAGHDKGTHMH